MVAVDGADEGNDGMRRGLSSRLVSYTASYSPTRSVEMEN